MHNLGLAHFFREIDIVLKYVQEDNDLTKKTSKHIIKRALLLKLESRLDANTLRTKNDLLYLNDSGRDVGWISVEAKQLWSWKQKGV